MIRNSMSITQRFRKEAERENIESYNFWFNRITEIAMAGIKYENLPPEIDARFIELILCFDGKALFYYDEDLEEFVVLQLDHPRRCGENHAQSHDPLYNQGSPPQVRGKQGKKLK